MPGSLFYTPRFRAVNADNAPMAGAFVLATPRAEARP